MRLRTLRALVGRLADEPERALVHAHTLQALLPDENLGREIASLSERARKSVTANASKVTFASDVPLRSSMTPIGHRTRRQATILSASFISSGGPVDDLAPEMALAAIDPLLLQAAEIVRANGGVMLDASENGLTASFGAPRPLEDHAAFACRAALDLRKLSSTSSIRICIAIDTGNVILSTAPEPGRAEVRGGPVTRAHALNQALRRDLVIATRRAQAAADGFVTMRELPSLAIPGYPEDQRLFEVMQINRGRSRWQLRAERQLSPFVGREIQLQMLNKAWHDTYYGEGQTVMIVGDPGIGKSRMTHEFVGVIPVDEFDNLEGGALEQDLRSGFVVMRKILQGLFGISDMEAPQVASDKLLKAFGTRGLEQRLLDPMLAVMELPTREPLWATLSGTERSRRMQEATVALLMRLARTKPVVLLVEDLHWIDHESEAILTRLAQAVPAVRFLLILTCRPEYNREVFSAAQPVEIRLSGLNPNESATLIDYLIGRDAGLGNLRRKLAEVCKGNALFLEETVRNLAETDKLVGKRGHYRPAGKVGEIVVSSNIHSIIDARFERMDDDAKHVAEVASIFGDDIPLPSLRRMAALPEARFDAAIRSLRNADLLVEVQIFPDAAWRFKHALIRNAISDRILSTTLVELHKAALTELEACYADRLEENSERLARHAELAQLWQEAAGYLLNSAKRAIKRSAHESALEQLDHGIEIMRANNIAGADELEIDFQFARGVALTTARGWRSPEVVAAFERAEVLCRKTGDRARLVTAFRAHAQHHMLRGKPASVQEIASRLTDLAKSVDLLPAA
ncbi:ATP-binding protein [Taklimakanibacter deserti]|uniref:ATP-binding protein n=1 Tax=Taklimakanibacter deserti TaxID=2267839 RepID=UPI000E65C813